MAAQTPRYITAEQVNNTLTWPLVNEAVEEALKAVIKSEPDISSSYVDQPQRLRTTAGKRSCILMTMPGFVGNFSLDKKQHNTLACKLVTSFATNEQRQPPLPNILANILLFDTETGALDCIMDGTQITAWRTAAASIIATKYLYFKRFPDFTEHPIKVAIIGCGVQGQSHAHNMCATFKVTEIHLWNRTTAKAEALSASLSHTYPQTKVYVAQSASDAVADGDVICIGTYAANALIEFAMLKKRVLHINTVGAGQIHFGEVAQDIYDNATVYVDSWANARTELKDLKANIIAEVGEVIKGVKNPPSMEGSGITIFQSMGMAAEDATVAQAIFEKLKNTEREN